MALVSSPNLTVPPSPTTRSSPSPTPSNFKGNIDLVHQWDEATVGEWLKSVNCGKYRQIFASNNINGDALLDCDQNILKEVGVNKVGDRIRIMVAVKSLRNHSFQLNKAARAESVGSQSPTTPYAAQHRTPNSANTSPILSSQSDLSSPSYDTTSSSRLKHHKSVPSIDGSSSIMRLDNVRQTCAKFIGQDGETRIVQVTDCSSSRTILAKVLKKFNIQDDPQNWCIYVTKERGGYSRLTDAELLQICHDPTIPERERLILTKRYATPATGDLQRAQAIAREQAREAIEKLSFDKGAVGLGRTKTNKLEGFFGERPHSFQRSNIGGSPREGRYQKSLSKIFGERPPSEVISGSIAEYFPDQERGVLEETLRNSIRRSQRMSQGGRRFSAASTSTAGSREKDIPPLPTLGEVWKDGPPKLTIPRMATRPLSLRRAVSSASYSNSIAESANEDDEDVDEEKNGWSVVQGIDDEATVRPAEPKYEKDSDENSEDDDEEDSEEEEEEEDSEEEYEEGEFDAVGGGPTRWIRGALIGSGSFGSVYLGMNRMSGELMAVKQVELPSHDVQGEQRKQSMLIALQREISLLRDLTHDNIVHYIGSSTDEKYLNIFLEYVPGGSVLQLLQNYGPFEEPLVRNFVRQILAGLNYLHERDIIHRDIKGANVLVDNKGVIKISDFGISKKVEANLLSTAAPHGHPHRPSLQGSVYWMAPEVVKQTSYTRKADIWSLGCLIVEMFTGAHPFPDFSQMQAIFKIGTACTPDIPTQSSDDAKDFLTKTFELDHHSRPSAADLMKHPFLGPMDEKSKSEQSSSAPTTPTKFKHEE